MAEKSLWCHVTIFCCRASLWNLLEICFLWCLGKVLMEQSITRGIITTSSKGDVQKSYYWLLVAAVVYTPEESGPGEAISGVQEPAATQAVSPAASGGSSLWNCLWWVLCGTCWHQCCWTQCPQSQIIEKPRAFQEDGAGESHMLQDAKHFPPAMSLQHPLLAKLWCQLEKIYIY